MSQEFSMQVIARVRSDFSTKFGVPRQSGLVDALEATVVFEPEFRNGDALRGLEGFSHLWLVWVFDQAIRSEWSPTVRPPRLGGNRRMGVFATRSPFRPNPIALSSVKLAGIEQTEEYGTVLRIRGADLMDGTPVLDIKPYIPYADCHPDALGGFAAAPAGETLEVVIPEDMLSRIPAERAEALRAVLAQDPRPHYQNDPERVYGFGFAGMEVRFSVEGDRLTVRDIQTQDTKA
ncbi:MAG: tRNA (N6-threonylcarbamoyladenosine(37)-N6)-methyltransferase TrmO [Oscillospiraceae bacterium]|nr:tRNA (N6-threonylcarbamoyladenosine(37)-N6)-methyltransferase TrmO [Oscillospiraceae bacterium]